MRVPEGGRHRVAVRQLARVGLLGGIRVVAGRELLLAAEEAIAAGDDERHDHALADFQPLVALAHFDHLAHEFMAEHVALLHPGDVVIVQVHVRTADRGRGDANDGVTRIDDLRIRHRLHADIVFSLPGQCAHGYSSSRGAANGGSDVGISPVSMSCLKRRSSWRA